MTPTLPDPTQLAEFGLAADIPQTVILLALLSLLPFLAVMVTSFAKMAVVLGILRSALGSATVPPTTVLTSLALLLSCFVMAPVAQRAHAAQAEAARAGASFEARLDAAAGPLRDFLLRHSRPEDRLLFLELAAGGEGVAEGTSTPPGEAPALRILVPAFLLGELREAFRIGFLLFLPFLVVDLVVSAVTLSLGMHMLSPTTVSLPLKLLLFVATDGWQLLAEALVRGYLPGGGLGP
ncbi:MAG: flagellar type III secretion system pore protein FliP [Deltaproteobacteria bacterium]|nr:flagellar type III secretion system pore protein FliP [Deltaproteobacteria bacterium]